MPKGTTLTSYKPNLRDKVAWALSDMFGGDRGTTNYINEKVRGAADLVPVLGDLIGGEETVDAFNEGRYGDAALSGATTAVGSIPGVGDAAAAGLKAGGSALGMLIGPMARNFRMGDKYKAMDMASEGRNAPEIWSETQTMFDPQNGVWQQEIPDFHARVHPSRAAWERDGKMTARLGDVGFSDDVTDPDMLPDVLTHPEFFEAYPDAKDIGVMELGALGHGGPGGVFYRSPAEQIFGMPSSDFPDLPPSMIGVATPHGVGLDAAGDMSPKSVMLHELQHWIQAKEGWDPGFNPQAAMEHLIKRPTSWPSQVYQNSLRDLAKITEGPVVPSEFLGTDIGDRIASGVSMEAYKRNVGETQARAVQKRATGGADISRMFDPSFEMDRGWGDQLSVYDLMYGKYSPEEVPGLSLRGPARRKR